MQDGPGSFLRKVCHRNLKSSRGDSFQYRRVRKSGSGLRPHPRLLWPWTCQLFSYTSDPPAPALGTDQGCSFLRATTLKEGCQLMLFRGWCSSFKVMAELTASSAADTSGWREAVRVEDTTKVPSCSLHKSGVRFLPASFQATVFFTFPLHRYVNAMSSPLGSQVAV